MSVIRLPNERKNDLRKYFKVTSVRNRIQGYKKEIMQGRASVLYDVMSEIVIEGILHIVHHF